MFAGYLEPENARMPFRSRKRRGARDAAGLPWGGENCDPGNDYPAAAGGDEARAHTGTPWGSAAAR